MALKLAFLPARVGRGDIMKPNRLGAIGGHKIKIKGKLVNIHLARITYKCQVCHGSLERHNMGLRCIANRNHRGFVHQKQVEQVSKAQQENIKQLSSFYEIVNGKVIIKCQ